MKKFIIFIVSLVFSINSFACDNPDIIGSWISEDSTVVWTFICDSVYIDQIGNEGFEYAYHINNDILTYQDEVDKIYNIYNTAYIVSLDKRYLVMKFDDESNNIYIFTKKTENFYKDF